jgi:hypothetical protein
MKADLIFYYNDLYHLLIFPTLYRTLFTTPTLATPFTDWTVAGYRTILFISEIIYQYNIHQIHNTLTLPQDTS